MEERICECALCYEGRHREATRRVLRSLNVAKIVGSYVSTLTGRSCELVAALERPQIDLCVVEEMRDDPVVRRNTLVTASRQSTTVVKGRKTVLACRLNDLRLDSRGAPFLLPLMKVAVVTVNKRLHLLLAYAQQRAVVTR